MMAKHRVSLSALLALFALMGAALADTPGLVTYLAPEGAVLSQDYSVQVNGTPSPVYRYGQAFTSFDTGGPVTVTVTGGDAIHTAVVRPLKLGIKPTLSGRTISFTLNGPQNVEVEVNGNTDKPLFVCANPIQVNPPKQGDPHVLYYGPGIQDIGAVTVDSNTTVYIAGGAILRGRFIVNLGSNIKILGRGILLETGKLLVLVGHHVLLQGFVVADKSTEESDWSVVPFNSTDVTIDNLKIFPNMEWGHDGLDIVACRNVEVKNCCIRSLDDCITAKSFGGDISDYDIHDDVLWSSGQDVLDIGFELNCDSVSNIHYHDLNILHWTGGWAAMSIHNVGWGLNPGRAKVSHVVYENINVEDCTGRLFDIVCVPNLGGEGTADGVTYRNINVLSGSPVSHIQIGADFINHLPFGDPGKVYTPDHTVQNITFDNLQILGKTILSPADGKFQIGPNSKNIAFK